MHLWSIRAIRRIGIALITVMAACHAWRVQPGTPVSAIQSAMADSTRTVRLTLRSGTTAVLHEPRLVADSIVGLSYLGRKRVAFAATDVRSIARHEISKDRTALVVLGGTVAVLFTAVVIGLHFSHWR